MLPLLTEANLITSPALELSAESLEAETVSSSINWKRDSNQPWAEWGLIPRGPGAVRNRCYQCHCQLDHVANQKGNAAVDKEPIASAVAVCGACAALNLAKREARLELPSQRALVTGGRSKIGFAVALRLLEAGAHVIITTRFPFMAAEQFACHPRAKPYIKDLHIYGLDFRHLQSLTRFCDHVLEYYPRLGVVVHNAAQTVRRPPAYYRELFARERFLVMRVVHSLDVKLGQEAISPEVENMVRKAVKFVGANPHNMNATGQGSSSAGSRLASRRRAASSGVQHRRKQEELVYYPTVPGPRPSRGNPERFVGAEPYLDEPLSDSESEESFEEEEEQLHVQLGRAAKHSHKKRNKVRRALQNELDTKSSLNQPPELLATLLRRVETAVGSRDGAVATDPMSALLSSALAMVPLLPSDREAARQQNDLFPAGHRDRHGQPLDLRQQTSWTAPLDGVPVLELMEVLVVNAVAPFLLTSRLLPALRAAARDTRGLRSAFVINVTSQEGVFTGASEASKSAQHPHTNMGKAALNMLTRTVAGELAPQHVFVCAVDPGWVSQMRPNPKVLPPLSEEDAAARIIDPIVLGVESIRRGDIPVHGVLLQHYRVVDW